MLSNDKDRIEVNHHELKNTITSAEYWRKSILAVFCNEKKLIFAKLPR